MSTNPDESTSQSADENPYAPPQAPIGGAGSAEVPSDMAEAEAIRRKYLSHEASVTSIGSLHYLGVVGGVIALVMTVFKALSRTPEMPEGINSVLFVATAVYLFVFVSVNLLLGIGLTGLKSWARWTEVVFSSILLLIYLVVAVMTAVFLKGERETGSTIAGSVVTSLILCYILYLLLCRKGSMVFSAEYRLIIERTPRLKYRTSWILKGCLIFVVVVILLAVIGAILSRWR